MGSGKGQSRRTTTTAPLIMTETLAPYEEIRIKTQKKVDDRAEVSTMISLLLSESRAVSRKLEKQGNAAAKLLLKAVGETRLLQEKASRISGGISATKQETQQIAAQIDQALHAS